MPPWFNRVWIDDSRPGIVSFRQVQVTPLQDRYLLVASLQKQEEPLIMRSLIYRTPKHAGLTAFLAFWAVLAIAGNRSLGADVKAQARAVLELAGVHGGLVVHLGCGDGALTSALHASDAYLVQGLECDSENVRKARAVVQKQGLYGPVSIEPFSGARLPYADNLVNLIVVSQSGEVPDSELIRVLAPGGVACVKQGDSWIRTTKPRPNDIDDWTHYMHGADNNPVAQDLEVGPPRSLQWRAGPMWSRSHDGVPSSIVLVLSEGGRLFSVVDEGVTGQPRLPSRWTLVARDAFNGVLLWKKPIPRKIDQKSLVAADGKLFGALGNTGELIALDATNGKLCTTYADVTRVREIVTLDGVLIAYCQAGPAGQSSGSAIVAVTTDTGQVKWRVPVRKFANSSLAAADDHVCFYDGSEVVCMRLQDGEPLWRAACTTGARSWPMMIYGGAVLVPTARELRAFSLETGKQIWTGPKVDSRLGAFGAEGLVWINKSEEYGRSFLWNPAPVVTTGLDPLTGVVKRTVEVSHLLTPGHHIRCYVAKATERYILLPKRGVEFVDLQGHDHMRNNWVRGACRHGFVPANGLLYLPPHPCFCYPGVKLAGYNALSKGGPDPIVRPSAASTPRLVKGVAFTRPLAPADSTSAGDWPMYRHDSQRSGHAGCTVPIQVASLWQAEIGGDLTQPVVAGDHLLVAQKNAHTIHCLDAETGAPCWSRIVGGRIDSAPTIYRGRVLFGSTDGWVHCLDMTDGELAWRFRAAPDERRVVVLNQLESAWPAHGSVLVQNGVVYCSAGRSSFLDGGIHLYALDPATGEIQYENQLDSQPPDVNHDAGRPFDMDGAKADLLVGDGTDLYLYQNRFSPTLSRKDTPRITKLGDRKVSLHLMSNAGFLDTTWFDRNFWTFSRRWPGYYFSYNGPKSGQILVFDDTTTYGLHVFETRQGHSPRFWPGTNGYQLFADSNDNEPVLRPTAIGREKGEGFSRSRPAKWITRVPLQMKGLVLAGAHLFGVGPPDVVPDDDPAAAFEGKLGSRLWVASTADGEKVAEYPLQQTPIFDGLIAAREHLYMATEDGRLICFGEK